MRTVDCLNFFSVKCGLAKGLLLCGKEEGMEMVKEVSVLNLPILLNIQKFRNLQLFASFCNGDEIGREQLCAQLCDLFDFDSAANDPRRCLFRTTFLWRQR